MATVEQPPGLGLAGGWTLDDLEAQARARLPRSVYDYFAGGAEDEAAVRGNRAAFQSYRFRHRVLTGAAQPDIAVELFGQVLQMPLAIAPMAAQRMAHPDGELAMARAAGRSGVAYALSTLSSASIEEVAASSGGARWFQLYVYKDRSLTTELIGRAAISGYSAVLLTVDAPYLGRRERDLRNAFTLPAGIRYENLVGALARSGSAELGESALANYFNTQLEPGLTWGDLEWLAAQSRLPVVVKGVVRGDDARRCLSSGAAGVIVSNHGGRQLDYSVATLEALPEVVEAVGGAAPVLIDGGIRRGTDVLKAIALGARGVLIGRPFLWALTVGGEDGVRRMLDQLREEITLSMSLLGARTLAELTPDLVRRSA